MFTKSDTTQSLPSDFFNPPCEELRPVNRVEWFVEGIGYVYEREFKGGEWKRIDK